MFYFISHNVGKYKEVKSLIPEIQHLDIELPEIQSLDCKVIIKAKLDEAKCHHSGEFLIEDTSLHLRCLGGLPGPFIKWFLQSLGAEGLFNLVARTGDYYAEAKTYFGYMNALGEAKYYQGTVVGQLVKPRGSNGFGWDRLFQPEGFQLTFAEMSEEQKRQISMRRRALEAFLKDWKKF